MGFAIYTATAISPITSQEAFFPPDHHVSEMFELLPRFYADAGDDVVKVNMVWGVKGKSKCFLASAQTASHFTW